MQATELQNTSRFNQARNLTKSLMALQGILKGLVADTKLNELEILYLETWITSHSALPLEGDVLDLQDNISTILSDGVISYAELKDLQEQINDILDYGEIAPSCIEDLTNELLGFVSGISADNTVTIEELEGLLAWLNDNPECAKHWPGDVLSKKLIEILEDGIVEPEELEDLTETCKMIAGQQFLETGAAAGMATEFCATQLDFLPSSFSTICFTGKFLQKTRAQLKTQAENLGIKPVKDVTQSLDLLVIGSLANPNWRFTSHGRKIEKALMNKKKGIETHIITEDNWNMLISN